MLNYKCSFYQTVQGDKQSRKLQYSESSLDFAVQGCEFEFHLLPNSTSYVTLGNLLNHF